MSVIEIVAGALLIVASLVIILVVLAQDICYRRWI